MNLFLILYVSFIVILFISGQIWIFDPMSLSANNFLITISLVLLMTFLNYGSVKDLKAGLVFSIRLPIILPAMVFLDPFFAAFVAALSSLDLLRYKKEWYKVLFNFSAMGTSTLIPSLLIKQMFNIDIQNIFSGKSFILIIFSGLLYVLILNSLVLLVVSIEKRKLDINALVGIISALKTSATTIFLGLINVILYYFTNIIGVAAFTFLAYFLRPAITYRHIFNNELLACTNFTLYMIKKKDPITYEHCERVKYWTVLLAENMKLPKTDIVQLSRAASWHDIGKIEIPNEILTKPGKLTPEEYEVMKTHPEVGYQLVKDIHFFKKFLPVIRHHHERYDGKGYPMGLKDKQIPLHARIMCIADSFDAMTADRQYKEGMTMAEAVSELKRCAGTQFDPDLVDMFIDGLKKQFGNNYEKWDKSFFKNVS
ncbi:HD-GYP domain-containing protein [Microaerobacter geothermalis]|uniref:HD-GYP domain-containing protein n=1 Tax=Microaerobacter geothermalis TaxID=674972 RepID=UPI001F3047CB|nr:HD domain-containing phosphohydrolase [Microaerobacter geothermalis]MCF6092841.1 HD-GYP domain-containing protein [Microaerobacter geothermalis]